MPDFDDFIDLKPLDISPAQIYLDSVEVARTVLPEFNLRVGTIEDAMFQAFAYMSSLNIGSINRLPESLFLGAIKLLGTQYNEGSRPTMDVLFTANSNDGASVPLGTIIQNTVTNDEFTLNLVFETNSLLTIEPNNEDDALPTGSIACTAQIVGIIPEIAANTKLQILSYVPSLFSAVANGNFVQGSEPESLSGYMDRGTARIASMSSALATSRQAQAFVISENPNLVTRVRVYDLTDKDGNLLVGDAPAAGHITVFAYGPRRFLTTEEKDDITLSITNQSVAGLDIGVRNPTLCDLRITASISHFETIESAALKEQFEDNIAVMLSVDNFPFLDDERIRKDDVRSIFLSNPLVRNVSSLSIDITDSGNITGAVANGTTVVYTSTANKFAIGDLVAVTGITPSGLNSTQRAITARTTNTFTVANSSASGTYVSGGTCAVTYANWGAASGDDYLFSKKGTLINISRQKIVLTLTAV